MNDESRKAMMKKIDDDIDRVGWSVIGVFAADEPTPPFSYTIGLWQRYQHPEVLVVGLPQGVAHYVLNDIGRRVADGERIPIGEPVSGLVADYKVQFREIPKPLRPLNLARSHYDGDDFEAIQCVWPDMQHRFPWEDGYDVDPRIQPLADGTPW